MEKVNAIKGKLMDLSETNKYGFNRSVMNEYGDNLNEIKARSHSVIDD